jgi:hypothetical protein
MSFREINGKYLEPGSQVLMILGIVALCQPWNFFLHRYGVTLTLIGLVGFLVTSHIGRKPAPEQADARAGEGAH